MSLLKLFRWNKQPELVDFAKLFSFVNEVERKLYKQPEEVTEADREEISKIYSIFYPSLHVIPSQRQATHHTFLTFYTFVYSAIGYTLFKNYQEWVHLYIYQKLIFIFFFVK